MKSIVAFLVFCGVTISFTISLGFSLLLDATINKKENKRKQSVSDS